MTTHTSEPDTTSSTDPGSPFSRGLMPAPLPVRFLDDDGRRVQTIVDDYAEPAPEQLVEAYRRMVIGRRFDIQATALTKQGRLAVYPSSRGQEACQVGGDAGAAAPATGPSRPTGSPSRWSPAASTRSRC